MTNEQDQARQDALADLRAGYAPQPATRDKTGITWTRDGSGHDTVEAPVAAAPPEDAPPRIVDDVHEPLVGNAPPAPSADPVEVDESEAAMANLRAGYAPTDEAA